MQPSKVESFWDEDWKEIATRKATRRNYYEISNYGRLRSVHKKTGAEKLLQGITLPKGYKRLSIRLKDEEIQSFYVHRLVAEYFLPPPEKSDKTWIIHLDNDKSNNHVSNLRWVSREELTAWHMEHGVYDINPEKRPSNVKMTDAKVRQLRRLVTEGKLKHTEIAKSFGISMVQFRKILKRDSWKHVENGEEEEE